MIELAILGALKERPMHGYELKKRLSTMLGHFWQISFGSLYPALKRLEANDAIEKAYTVKEKTRNRYVYRITKKGNELFEKMISEPGTSAEIADAEKFNLRMAFFRYMEPEARLWTLERRRAYLQEKLNEMRRLKKSSKDKDADAYRAGLFRHRIEIAEADISWLNELIERERQQINLEQKMTERKRKRKSRKEVDKFGLNAEEAEGKVSATNV